MLMYPGFAVWCQVALERVNGEGVIARIVRTFFWGACFVVSVKLLRWVP